MGKAKRQAQLCSSSYDTDSSDYSDDEHPALDARRYQAADLQQGLQTRCVAGHSMLLSWNMAFEAAASPIVLWHLSLISIHG
jgi:hypothetical protein